MKMEKTAYRLRAGFVPQNINTLDRSQELSVNPLIAIVYNSNGSQPLTRLQLMPRDRGPRKSE
jgi:hypothetical protein